jgi:cytochrome P450
MMRRYFRTLTSFIPSRWETAKKEMRDTIMPFAIGVRNCIGQPLVVAEINAFAPRIVDRFDFRVNTPGRPCINGTYKYAGAQIQQIIRAN